MKKVLLACLFLLCPMVAWAQESQTAVFDEDGKIESLVTHAYTGSGDSGFDKIVDWSLASASDPVGLTDVALQLAEAEKIMLRPHGSICSASLFQLAIRAAVKQGNEEALGRIAKGAKQYGLDEIAKNTEASKKLAGDSRPVDRGSDNRMMEALAKLSDDEKFQFGLSQHMIAASSDDPESLKKVRGTLAEDTKLPKVAKDYFLAEMDNQIKELEALSEGEREALLALAGPSRQAQGRLIASSGLIESRDSYARADGYYELYENGSVKIKHFICTNDRFGGGADSVLVMAVTTRVNNKNHVLWATKHVYGVGSNPTKNNRKEMTEWRSMSKEYADMVKNGRATIQFAVPVSAGGSMSALRGAYNQLAARIGQDGAKALEAWLFGG